MSEVRANGGELDGAAQLLASARARVSAAMADLALPEALRLSDRQRITVSHLLRRLVGDVEDELRSALAAHFAADGDEPSARRPVLGEPGDRGARAGRRRSARRSGAVRPAPAPRRGARLARAAPERRLLTELAGDSDEEVAAAAVSLLIAESRRLDAFQEPLAGRAATFPPRSRTASPGPSPPPFAPI